MLGKEGPANLINWSKDALNNLSFSEYKKMKKIQEEGNDFGRPSNEDLYDSDIDEDLLEEEENKECPDMEYVLEQKVNDLQHPQHIDPKALKVEDQVSESDESESEEDSE